MESIIAETPVLRFGMCVSQDLQQRGLVLLLWRKRDDSGERTLPLEEALEDKDAVGLI